MLRHPKEEINLCSLTLMATDYILAMLFIERDKLTAAIEALQGPTTREKTPGPGRNAVPPTVEQDSKPPETVGPAAPVERKLSAAGRRAIITGTKKRWAAVKAANTIAATPTAVTPKAATAQRKTSAAKSAASRKKMSERMKVAWAAREKRAASKKAS